MVKVFCKNTGTVKEFKEGTTLLDMVPHFEFEKPYAIISAKVNNISEGLKYRVFNNRDVEFLDYRSYSGRNVYCRSLCFLLCKAARDLFPACRIVLRRPISKGYYCELVKGDGSNVDQSDVDSISARMRTLVEENIPFKRNEVRISDAISLFSELGYEDKVKLLKTSGEVYISYYTLGDTADYYYDSLVPSSGYLKVWDLSLYKGGLLLRVPDRHRPDELAPFHEQPKTFEIFKETLSWNRIMGLDNVGDVNEACLAGKATDLIEVAEALQERKIVWIAEEIKKRYYAPENPIRIVLITGPTSSGKRHLLQKAQCAIEGLRTNPGLFLH